MNKKSDTSNLLDSLNPEQREAAQHDEGPLLILAGAGSGKTRVMTYRIAYLINELGVAPSRILAMTFTNKAANEMRERANKLLTSQSHAYNVLISTFHAFGVRLLRAHSDAFGLSEGFSIYDQSDQSSAIKRVINILGWDKDRENPSTYRHYIDRQKNRGYSPETSLELANDKNGEERALFYAEYQKFLRENNAVDFGDLILLPLELFRNNPAIADYYSNRWQYIMVDEYQDTNPAQDKLLKFLTSQHKNIAVVGDDDQSIYSWRGATVDNILSFDRTFAGTKVVKLERNYRSTQTILEAANDVISQNQLRHPKKLWTENVKGEKIIRHLANDDISESIWVAQKLLEWKKEGEVWDEIAVFYRTNAQSRLIEEQLLTHSIPYRIIGGMSFYQRAEIKDLLAYLRIAINPVSDIDFERVINTPKRGVGSKSLELLRIAAELPHVRSMMGALQTAFSCDFGNPDAYAPEIEAIRAMRAKSGVVDFFNIINAIRQELSENISPVTILNELISRIGYYEYLERTEPDKAEDKINNVGELVSAINEYEAIYLSSLSDEEREQLVDGRVDSAQFLQSFLERSVLLTNLDNAEGEDGAVTLMTIHGSKGLEFDNVILTGMELGLFPSRQSLEESDSIDEERRLAYVAITRARKRLVLTAAQRRQTHGKYVYNPVSPFLFHIGSEWICDSDDSLSFDKNTDPFDFDEEDDPFSPYQGRRAAKQSAKSSSRRSHYDDYSQNTVTYPEEEEWTPDASPSKRPSSNLSGKLAEGVTVLHKTFGAGKVVAFSGSGDLASVTVLFPAHGEKKIIRKFLQILG